MGYLYTEYSAMAASLTGAEMPTDLGTILIGFLYDSLPRGYGIRREYLGTSADNIASITINDDHLLKVRLWLNDTGDLVIYGVQDKTYSDLKLGEPSSMEHLLAMVTWAIA
jgi:hypothetical protein